MSCLSTGTTYSAVRGIPEYLSGPALFSAGLWRLWPLVPLKMPSALSLSSTHSAGVFVNAMAGQGRKNRVSMPGLALCHILFLFSLFSSEMGALGDFGFFQPKGSVTVKGFGMSEGQQVDMYTLTWGEASADILTLGATLRGLRVPDRYGNIDDVVTGFDTIEPYNTKQFRFGCIKGRIGTGLTNGGFNLNGRFYNISKGGGNSFCYKVYKATPIRKPWGVGVRLTYLSPAGEDGYPGNLLVTATYMLRSRWRVAVLTLRIRATTDAATYVNLIHHPYFNLGGHKPKNLTKSGLANEVKFNADRYTPVNVTDKIPDGRVLSVKGTPFDLREWTTVGTAVNNYIAGTALPNGTATVPGFDDYFVLSPHSQLMLLLRYRPAGRMLAIFTNQPGFVFFTGHKLDTIGKGGVPYTQFSFFALEPAGYRDAPNWPNFPPILLNPGQFHVQRIQYVLGTVPDSPWGGYP